MVERTVGHGLLSSTLWLKVLLNAVTADDGARSAAVGASRAGSPEDGSRRGVRQDRGKQNAGACELKGCESRKDGVRRVLPGQLGAVPEGGGREHGQRAAGRRPGGGGVRQGMAVVAEGPPPSGPPGVGGAHRAQHRGVVVAQAHPRAAAGRSRRRCPGDVDYGLDAALLTALRHLPDRQREVIALRPTHRTRGACPEAAANPFPGLACQYSAGRARLAESAASRGHRRRAESQCAQGCVWPPGSSGVTLGPIVRGGAGDDRTGRPGRGGR